MTILTLPYPPSANRAWRTRVAKGIAMTYQSPEAKEFKAKVHAIVRAAGINKPLLGRVKLELWLFPNRPKDWQARQRKFGPQWDDGVQSLDLDNVNKVLLDSLKNLVFEDDKSVFQLLAQRMEPDERGARVVVRVSAIPAAQPQGALP